jgi:5'-deoxynucleotidase YfbR-like HD superfamily hydrolase
MKSEWLELNFTIETRENIIMKIETVTGNLFDPLAPDVKDISIDDIAWSLSRISRFAGHTITEIPYTVGQHCIFVADEIFRETGRNDWALYGMLHDAGEAYLGDIPSPIKRLPQIHQQIEQIESNILLTIYKKFELQEPLKSDWDIVKHYDKRAQFIEAFNFMCSRGLDWVGRENYDINLIDIQRFPQPKPAIEVYTEYKQAFFKYYTNFKGVWPDGY